jgi:uncharacterized protein (DUF58 family)
VAVKVSIADETFRQFDRLALVSRRPARGGTGGEHHSRRPAPSTDFVDYRPYQPGDDFRRIDWNVYGRLGSLQLKLTEGRERLDVFVILDCSSSMAYGTPDKLQYAAQLVAALAYIGTSRTDAVHIACLAQPAAAARFGPFSRRARLPELARQLSSVAAAGLVDLSLGLSECIPDGAPSTSLAIVVSDLLSPNGVASGLATLQARVADVAVLHLISPEELEPQISGEVELIDAESGAALELGISLGTLAAYRARLAAWLDERAAECRRRGLRYIRVTTDRPLAAVVLDDLRRGGLLK